MRKLSSFVSCALLLLVFISGCSKATEGQVILIPVTQGQVSDSRDNSVSSDLDILSDRKVVKNAYIDCSADDVSEKYQTLLSWLRQNNGYEFSQNMTKRDDYTSINAVFKISPDNFDAFLDVISDKTEIINLRITTNDITDSYIDTALRLKSKRAALEQYYVMLEKAVTVNEILSIQKTINDLTSEIESMEGKLVYWDKQVSECTITISISQANDPSRPKKQVSFSAMSFGDMFSYIGNGFMVVINFLVGFLQWVLIILISLSPLIAIALAVIFAIRYVKKRKNNINRR